MIEADGTGDMRTLTNGTREQITWRAEFLKYRGGQMPALACIYNSHYLWYLHPNAPKSGAPQIPRVSGSFLKRHFAFTQEHFPIREELARYLELYWNPQVFHLPIHCRATNSQTLCGERLVALILLKRLHYSETLCGGDYLTESRTEVESGCCRAIKVLIHAYALLH